MSRKREGKPFWEMNAEELRTAAKLFDNEFVADKARPMSPAMKARWEKAKEKGSAAKNGRGQLVIAVQLEKTLLDRCMALAKKKGISRNALIVRSVKALVAAESEQR